MHDYAAMLAFIDLCHHSRNNCYLVVVAAGVGHFGFYPFHEVLVGHNDVFHALR